MDINFGIYANEDKDLDFEFTKIIIKYLNDRNIVPYLEENNFTKDESLKYHFVKQFEFYQKCNCIIVLGGDGTFLRVSVMAARKNIAIFGINLGTLGYLADVEKDDAIAGIEKIISGNYRIENRIMLEVDFATDTENHVALNDICITKGVNAKLISCSIKINGQFLGSFKADGLIVSTPTGSTAYNLAAGGPIIKPDSNVIVITPICPHNLYSRPFVLSTGEEIEIEVFHRSESEVVLSTDGTVVKYLENGAKIKVFTSKNVTKIIKTTDKNFYDILRIKMYE